MRLGILGGLGPAAGAEFFNEFTRLTPAEHDQDHYEVVLYSNPLVPDRSTSVLNGDNGPLRPLMDGMNTLIHWGADILAVPCNTAHIFLDKFIHDLPRPTIHIVEETLRLAREIAPFGGWLIGTSGLVASGIYQDYAESYQYPLWLPNDRIQSQIDKVITLAKSGDFCTAGDQYASISRILYTHHQGPHLAACTEIPLLRRELGNQAAPMISSLNALALGCHRALGSLCG